MSKKKTKPLNIIIPKGYDIDEFLDTDDGGFTEPPGLSEEVEITFE